MDYFENAVQQIKALNAELAELNDRADAIEARRALLTNIIANEVTWKNAPRVVRNYEDGSVSAYSGERKVA